MTDINVDISHIKLDPQQTNSSGSQPQNAQNLLQQQTHLRSGQGDQLNITQFYNQQILNAQFNNNNTNNNSAVNTNIHSSSSFSSSTQQHYPNNKQIRQSSNNSSQLSIDSTHQIPSTNIPNLLYQQFPQSQQQYSQGSHIPYAPLFMPNLSQYNNQLFNDQMSGQNNINPFSFQNQMTQSNQMNPHQIGGIKPAHSSQGQKQANNANRKYENNIAQFQIPPLGKSQSEQIQGQTKQGYGNNSWSTQNNTNQQQKQSFLDNYFQAGEFFEMKQDFSQMGGNAFSNQQLQHQQSQHSHHQIPSNQLGGQGQDENGFQGNLNNMNNNIPSSNSNNSKKNNQYNNNTNSQQQQSNQPQQSQSSSLDQRKLKIVEFKVHACTKRDKHEKKKCPYYHNDGDRRRCPEKYKYSFNECKKKDKCPLKDDCPQVHNKVEQLYHPLRYKAKFCESYKENNQKCEYGNFCSFAHHESEIMIPMICKLQKDAIFYMYFYKTVWCPNTQKHERAFCPYMHNVQDFRRDPKAFQLEPRQCEQWKKTNISKYSEGECPLQLKCTNCHGWKEHDYHPQVYKTKPCNIENCPQNLECVLYHSEEDKRNITPTLLKIEEEQARERLKSLINTSNQDVKLGAPIDVFYTETEEKMNTFSNGSSVNTSQSSYNNNNCNNNNLNSNNNNNNQNNQNNSNNSSSNHNNSQKNRGKSNTMNNQSHSYPHNRQSSNSQSGPSQGQYNNHQKNQIHNNHNNHNNRNQDNKYQNVNGNYNNNRQGKNNYNNSNYQPSNHNNINNNNNNNNNNNSNFGNNNYNNYQYQPVDSNNSNNNSNNNNTNTKNNNNNSNNNNNTPFNNNINNSDIQNSNFNNNNNLNNTPYSKTISNNNINQNNFNNYQANPLSQNLVYNNFASIIPSNNSDYNESKSVYSSNTEYTTSNYAQSRGSSVGKDDFDQQTIINQGTTNHLMISTNDIVYKQFIPSNINTTFSSTSQHFGQESSLSRKNSSSELQKYFEKRSQSELYELLLQNQYSDEDILRLANYQLPFLNENQKNALKSIIKKFNDDQEYKDIQNLVDTS